MSKRGHYCLLILVHFFLVAYYDYAFANEEEQQDGRFIPKPFDLSYEADDVKFYLFPDPDSENSTDELNFSDPDSIRSSRFKPEEKTVIVIHGFWSNASSGMPLAIKKGFLGARTPHNLILVDWGMLSSPKPKNGIYSPVAYPLIVKKNIPTVYQRVADFLQFLVNEKFTSLERIHIIGHSLGAHISGGVGNVLALNPENKGKKVARITGLDPAGPLFQAIRVQRRINKDDAEFVDIYHTAAGTLGDVIYDEGHADFMPNGGHHQPGCKDSTVPIFESEFGSCSHSFVYKIYVASITKRFEACKCEPKFVDYLAGKSCPGNCSTSVLAGDQCPTTARGQFYFETSEDP